MVSCPFSEQLRHFGITAIGAHRLRRYLAEMPFYDEERHNRYREGLFTSPRFWLGAFVTLIALLIGMSAVMMFRSWFG